MSYFWYSHTGSNEAWKLATSDQREHIVSNLKPSFVTVLDAQAVPQDDWAREDHLKMKYSGPLYFDWDSQDINKAIKDFQKTLVKLKDEYDVKLECIALYATGGRGFHVEIPMEVFISKPPRDGVVQLPYVYREIALHLATDSLDLKVYSGRRGRMWRTCNVVRSNGHYKVPITVADALAMTPELYDTLTSEPRDVVKLAPPEIAVGLQALFAEKRDSVEATVKRNAKIKDERRELSRFQGEFPPSVKLLMAGLHIREDAGFNNISLQFAILAVALGKSADEMLEACQGFIESHTSDGRYNSPRKRKEALRERYHYVDGNPCYVFSFGGLRSICEPGFSPDELTPQEGSALAVPVVGADSEVYTEDGSLDEEATLLKQEAATPEELRLQIRHANAHAYGGLSVTPAGVFQRMKDGDALTSVSPTGFMAVRMMRCAVNRHSTIGFEATLTRPTQQGRPQVMGRFELDYDAFSTRARLDKLLAAHSSCFRGSDLQAINFRQILVDQTMDNNDIVFVVRREGLDVIPDPRVHGRVEHIVIWSSPTGVFLAEDTPDAPTKSARLSKTFTYRPGIANNPTFRPTVHLLDPMQPSPENSIWLNHLLHFSKKPQTVANSLGWFVSCFHRQVHNHLHGQFPLLQFYGQAGSGKSTTPQTLAAMFWGGVRPKLNSAGRSGGTGLSRKAGWVGSCSPPLLLDEVKRIDLGEHLYADLMSNLRLAYNAGSLESAGISDGSADSGIRTVREFPRTTPICFMSETVVSETAVMERSVVVPMSQADQCPEHWEYINSPDGLSRMGHLGALLLWKSLRTSLQEYEAMFKQEREAIKSSAGFPILERPLVNVTIVWCGLRFLESALILLGVDARDRFDELRQATLRELQESGTAAPIPEVYKFMQDVAQMVNGEVDNDYEMREGHQYTVNEGMLEIRLRDLSVKYSSWCKARAVKPWYADYESMVKGLAGMDAVVDKFCANSPLKTSAATAVFRFDENRLIENGVEPFKAKAR